MSYLVKLPGSFQLPKRPTSTRRCNQAGISPKVVSERLGHSTVAMTLDVYSHVLPSLEAEAAERVASLVFGAR